MRKFSTLFLIPVSTLVLAVGLAGGCAVQDADGAAQRTSTADELAAAPLDPASANVDAMTCDDFDTFCGPTRPCGEGFVCTFVSGHCGSNFFGTFPDCGVSATCFPICQPK
jgi:hypothetical protein